MVCTRIPKLALITFLVVSHCFRLHILRLSVCLCLPSVLLLIRVGDIGSLSIDVFTFSPGQHVLRIDFGDVIGSAGVFEYVFFGAVRPSKSHIYGSDFLNRLHSI